MHTLDQIKSRIQAEGPRRGVRSLIGEALRSVIELNRTVILLTVDLRDPKHHLRERDRAAAQLKLLPFDETTHARLVDRMGDEEPLRARSLRQRLLEGMSGFVAESEGEVVGYVFWAGGTDDPNRLIHWDLHWLPIRPARDEAYTFDYFLIESARGLGGLFVRAVQEEQARMGLRAAYGYVYQDNRAALWLYRTTGWKEIGRIQEHRLLSRFTVVDKTLYRMGATRTPLFRIPRL